jgi:hypothetical protein
VIVLYKKRIRFIVDVNFRHGAGTVGSQQSGSADSDGETEGDSGPPMDDDAPLLLRSISTDTEATHSLAGPHTPLTPRKFQQQVIFLIDLLIVSYCMLQAKCEISHCIKCLDILYNSQNGQAKCKMYNAS